MPRILKSNYENAIARHSEAKKLRANRTKYPPPSKITVKELITITNKFKIGVGPSRTGYAAAAKNAKPLVSQRKIQNKINLNKFRLAKPKHVAEFKAAIDKKRRADALQKKKMSDKAKRQKTIKEINNLLNEIVNNIQSEEDMNFVIKNLFNGSPNNKAKPVTAPKKKPVAPKKKPVAAPKKKAVAAKKGKGSKLFTARKKAAKQATKVKTLHAQMKKNGAFRLKNNPIKQTPAVKKKKAVSVRKVVVAPKKQTNACPINKAKAKHPNYNNPHRILTGESWASHMSRVSKLKKRGII